MLLKREPSLSSMNVMPLESRRERTQPRKVISLPTDKTKRLLDRNELCGHMRQVSDKLMWCQPLRIASRLTADRLGDLPIIFSATCHAGFW